MNSPKFDRNDLNLIEIALKETGQKYDNLFEPMANLRVRIVRAIKQVEKGDRIKKGNLPLFQGTNK